MDKQSEKPKLTAKQERFIEEYLVDLNATQAAIRAGYSEKAAKETGCENLTKPNIAEEIAKRRKALSEKTGLNAEFFDKEVMEYLHTSKAIPIEIDGNSTTKYDTAGVGKALDMIGRRLNLFTHTVDHKSSDKSMTPQIYLPNNERD